MLRCDLEKRITAPYHGDTMQEALVQWISRCDARLLTTPGGEPARYGHAQQPISLPVMAGRFSIADTALYYKQHADELRGDTALCQDVCPVFVLHGCVTALQTTIDRYHASYETILVLHVLKRSLVAAGRDIGHFLRRLFHLIECVRTEKRRTYSLVRTKSLVVSPEPDHFHTIRIVFLTQNLDFMLFCDVQLRYTLCVEEVKSPGALLSIIERNLFDDYHCDSPLVVLYVLRQIDRFCVELTKQWLFFCASPVAATIAPHLLQLYVPVR